MQSTSPYFVRCVNPNNQKKPSQFDPDYVLKQLRCGGLIEALRVLKLGFPTRYACLGFHWSIDLH